jgi:hypothetical protein
MLSDENVRSTRIKRWTKKDLLREYNHIRKKDPTSYNWTSAARAKIKAEVARRKKVGTLRKDAGVKK